MLVLKTLPRNLVARIQEMEICETGVIQALIDRIENGEDSTASRDTDSQDAGEALFHHQQD
jgi:hypothetical protein